MLFIFPSNSPAGTTLDRCNGCAGQIKGLTYLLHTTAILHSSPIFNSNNLLPRSSDIAPSSQFLYCRDALCVHQVPRDPLRSHSSQSINHLFFVCVYRNGCLVLYATPTRISPLVPLTPLPPLTLLFPPISFSPPPKLQQRKPPLTAKTPQAYAPPSPP